MSSVGLRESERALLAGAGIEAGSLAWLVRSGSLTDVGLWTGRRRVRVGWAGWNLVLFAPGRRPYLETVRPAEARGSFYNHVTGEVVLGPCQPRVRTLAMRPEDGCRLLDVLGVEYGKQVPRGAQAGAGA